MFFEYDQHGTTPKPVTRWLRLGAFEIGYAQKADGSLKGRREKKKKKKREKKDLGPLTCWTAPDLHVSGPENSEFL
jgi:hypothetical protein